MYPIVLFVYNRPIHTKKVLDALHKNTLASESLLYIFIDGPKVGATSEDISKIDEVIKVCYSELWCKEVIIQKSNVNIGCRDSIIKGITEVLREHEGVIVLEDDIITSPSFLSYMNQALDFYKLRTTVFSISANSPSPSRFVIPDSYEYDVYASPRLFNWGWGTWKDRWEKADWSLCYFESFSSKIFEINAFNRGGDDMFKMLKEEYEGKSSAWDIQFAYTHFREHALSIVPCCSYTYSIGLDGSGTHCFNLKNDTFEVSQLNLKEQLVFLDTLYFDSRIQNLLYSSYSKKKRALWQKGINYLAHKFKLKAPFMVKDKIFYK